MAFRVKRNTLQHHSVKNKLQKNHDFFQAKKLFLQSDVWSSFERIRNNLIELKLKDQQSKGKALNGKNHSCEKTKKNC